MEAECYCDYDYDRPVFYRATLQTARKRYHCYECHNWIEPGDRYRYVIAKYSDGLHASHTCPLCWSLVEYTAAHVPCVCWAHGNVIDDCMGAIDYYAHEAPGLRFGALRLYWKIQRRMTIAAAKEPT